MTLTDDQAIAVLKSNGRSFYFASRLLGSRYRIRASRLYAFCRYVDDLVDESTDPLRASQDINILKVSLKEGHSTQPCVSNMIALMQSLSMPDAPVVSLIAGVQSDLLPRSIKEEAELLHYAYEVAGTVGLMMCFILDVRDTQAWPFAIDLGIAMQLTNIARDVGEDAAKGRVYLPASWLGDLSAADIINPNSDQQKTLQQATQRILKLADVYYQSGLAGVRYLPWGARYGIVVAAMVYREIGEVVADSGYTSWKQRAVVPHSRKVFCATKALTNHAWKFLSKWKSVEHDPALHQALQNCFGVQKTTKV
jgi:15-cis-phytoene synthase